MLGAIASVQFGATLATKLFDSVGPSGTVLLRLATGAVALMIVWRPRVRGRSRHALALAALFGVLLAVMNLCFYAALDRIPLGIAVTIEFIGPLMVAVLGSRRPVDFAWVVLAGAGIVALTRGDATGIDGIGVMFALLAGIGWAVYIHANARIGRAFGGASGLAVAMCIASVVALPFGVAEGGIHLLAPRTLLLGAAIGVLSSAIPYSLELEALRRIAAPVFGVLMSLEPAVAALAGFIVLGQGLSARSLAGIALVVLASIGASRRMSEPPVAP